MTRPNASALLASLSSHPHADSLAAWVLRVALRCAEKRRHELSPSADESAEPAEPAEEADLTADQRRTELGDVAEILRRGPKQQEESLLLSVLLGLGLRGQHPNDDAELTQLCAKLVWLATHTRVDALAVLDVTLGDAADQLWEVVARIAEDPSTGAPDFGRAEALVAAAAVGASPSAAARLAAEQVARTVEDPLLEALLMPEGGAAASAQPEPLGGELQPPPRSTLRLALLAFTGVLLLYHVARLVGRVALAYRRPARLAVSSRGLELSYRTELLGRVLNDRETVVPLSNLARVTREVRYARAGLYVGLMALALGTYFGVGLFVDGVRVPGGSLPLLGMGLLAILLGLAIDFGLTSLTDTLRGKCRVVVVPRRGHALCVGGLERSRADVMLRSVAQQNAPDAHE